MLGGSDGSVGAGNCVFTLKSPLHARQGSEILTVELSLSLPLRFAARVAEFFTNLGMPLRPELLPAQEWLREKRKPDGLWQLEHTHKGNVHFEMEAIHQPSRFITLKALRILWNYGEE